MPQGFLSSAFRALGDNIEPISSTDQRDRGLYKKRFNAADIRRREEEEAAPVPASQILPCEASELITPAGDTEHMAVLRNC